jgi:hypothetical protein
METGSMASEALFADVALPDSLATRPMASDTATAGRIPTRAVAADPAPSSPIALRPKAADQAETGRMVASTDITSPVISAPTNSELVVPANPDGPVVAARPVAANLIDATPVILESVEPTDSVPAASSPVTPIISDPIISDPIIFGPGIFEPIMSSEPIAAESLFSDIEASDPIIAGPVASRPVATDPIIPEQATSDPVAARPAISGRADAGPVTAGTTPAEADFAAPINSSAAISESIAVADTSVTEPADPGPAVAASAVADPVNAKTVLCEPIVVEPVIDEPVIDEPGTSVSDVAANQESIRPDINLPVGSVAGADTENQQLASNATEGPVVADRANISPFVDDFPPEIPTDIESRVDATKNVVSRTTSPEISPFWKSRFEQGVRARKLPDVDRKALQASQGEDGRPSTRRGQRVHGSRRRCSIRKQRCRPPGTRIHTDDSAVRRNLHRRDHSEHRTDAARRIYIKGISSFSGH